MTTNKKFVAPDGGWGWMVVLGVAMSNVVNQSLVSTFGLIFGETLESMGHGTTGAALVMNICSVVTNFSGLITGPAIKRFSVRKVAVLGCMLTATGFILSSFADTMWEIIISYSLFAGLGLGLIMPSTFVALNSYFTTRRGRAVGLAMAGTGLGQMLMPHVIRFLLDGYGFRGTTLLLGAIGLHGVAGTLLLQPVKWHWNKSDGRENEHKKLLTKTVENTGHQNGLPRNKSAVALEEMETGEKSKKALAVLDVESNEVKMDVTCWERFVSFMDLELLQDPVFIFISIGISLVYTANITFSMIFPFFLQESAGLTRGQTAMCMSALAGADIISRLTLPSITFRLKMSCRTTFLFGAILLGATRSLLAEQSNFTNMMIVSGLSGYARASTVINQNLSLSEYCTQEKLPAAVGLNMVMKGIAVMTLGQTLGWLRDYTDSFTICIHAQNALLLIMVLLWAPEMIYRRIQGNKLGRDAS